MSPTELCSLCINNPFSMTFPMSRELSTNMGMGQWVILRYSFDIINRGQAYVISKCVFEKQIMAAMTPDEIASWKKKYEKDSFPGLEVSLEDITSMMTAPDPGAAVGAKAISAAGQ